MSGLFDSDAGSVAGEWGVSVANGDRCVRVAAWGELDMYTAAELDATLQAIDGTAREVVLDLGELTFLDSTGIQLLLRYASQSARDRIELSIVSPAPHIARVLEIAGVTDFLPLMDGRPR